MAKTQRELQIAMLKIQAILLEVDAVIYSTEWNTELRLENADDSEVSIPFKNFGD